jgi:hypothetical protein
MLIRNITIQGSFVSRNNGKKSNKFKMAGKFNMADFQHKNLGFFGSGTAE